MEYVHPIYILYMCRSIMRDYMIYHTCLYNILSRIMGGSRLNEMQ